MRTFASIEHPDDHEYVARSVMESVATGRPFALEYRLVRRDGSVRWVLERGLAQQSGDGRWWLDGAIFDITARREAERALREHEVTEAQLAEVRASRARILDAADRARRDIERNLHDGAQQRLVSVALALNIWLRGTATCPTTPRAGPRGARRAAGRSRRAARSGPRAASGGAQRPRARARAARAGPARGRARRARDGPARERLPMAVEAAAYFAVSEALTNVARYAEASHASVGVDERDGELG